MSYVVLARKWRPMGFTDVLGQEHVTTTVQNAIGADRVAHAFMFSGPRGVGKTSMARILAKALCCSAGSGPTENPCGACTHCLQITEGRCTDVLEIDAASHTGVDNIREIIDNVRYLPSSARFKIYVIDEVHMLSTGAFNALLKTLEEPPPHVKFILATTDIHKVPVTILSRCQRFDFRRIPVPRIQHRLCEILEAENIDHDPDALSVLGRESEGSMRDAESLLEQVLAFAGGRKIDGACIREALGMVDGRILGAVIRALFASDGAATLEMVAEVYREGLDLRRFASSLVAHARALVVARIVPDPMAMLECSKEELDDLIALVDGRDSVELERLFRQLGRLEDDVQRSAYPRFALEVGLAALAEAPVRVSLEVLLERLERAEASLLGKGSEASVAKSNGPKPGARTSLPQPRATVSPTLSPTARPAPSEERPVPTPTPAKPSSQAPVAAKESGDRGFEAFVARLRKARPALAATLAQVRPRRFDREEVGLVCETAFDVQKLKDPEIQGFLRRALEEYLGGVPSLSISRGDGGQEGPKTLTELDDLRHAQDVKEREVRARAHPEVQKIEKALGAEVTRVRVHDADEHSSADEHSR
jgi:DNA polymerase III subunit gamma/tau